MTQHLTFPEKNHLGAIFESLFLDPEKTIFQSHQRCHFWVRFPVAQRRFATPVG